MIISLSYTKRAPIDQEKAEEYEDLKSDLRYTMKSMKEVAADIEDTNQELQPLKDKIKLRVEAVQSLEKQRKELVAKIKAKKITLKRKFMLSLQGDIPSPKVTESNKIKEKALGSKQIKADLTVAELKAVDAYNDLIRKTNKATQDVKVSKQALQNAHDFISTKGPAALEAHKKEKDGLLKKISAFAKNKTSTQRVGRIATQNTRTKRLSNQRIASKLAKKKYPTEAKAIHDIVKGLDQYRESDQESGGAILEKVKKIAKPLIEKSLPELEAKMKTLDDTMEKHGVDLMIDRIKRLKLKLKM